jgi:hypothetical protein
MYLSQWFSLRIDHLGCLLLFFVFGCPVSEPVAEPVAVPVAVS